MATGVNTGNLASLIGVPNTFEPPAPKPLTEEGQENLFTFIAAVEWAKTPAARETVGLEAKDRFLRANFERFKEAEPLVTAGIEYLEYLQWYAAIVAETPRHHRRRFLKEGKQLVIETLGRKPEC